MNTLATLPKEVLVCICDFTLENGDLKALGQTSVRLRDFVYNTYSKQSGICRTKLIKLDGTHSDRYTCNVCGLGFCNPRLHLYNFHCGCHSCFHTNNDILMAVCPCCSHYCRLCGLRICKDRDYCGPQGCINKFRQAQCRGCKTIFRSHQLFQSAKKKRSDYCKSCSQKQQNRQQKTVIFSNAFHYLK